MVVISIVVVIMIHKVVVMIVSTVVVMLVRIVLERSSEQDFDFHFLFLPAKSPENGLFCLIFHQILRFWGIFVSLDEFVHI